MCDALQKENRIFMRVFIVYFAFLLNISALVDCPEYLDEMCEQERTLNLSILLFLFVSLLVVLMNNLTDKLIKLIEGIVANPMVLIPNVFQLPLHEGQIDSIIKNGLFRRIEFINVIDNCYPHIFYNLFEFLLGLSIGFDWNCIFHCVFNFIFDKFNQAISTMFEELLVIAVDLVASKAKNIVLEGLGLKIF